MKIEIVITNDAGESGIISELKPADNSPRISITRAGPAVADLSLQEARLASMLCMATAFHFLPVDMSDRGMVAVVDAYNNIGKAGDNDAEA